MSLELRVTSQIKLNSLTTVGSDSVTDMSNISAEVSPLHSLLPYSVADFCLYLGNLNNWKTSQEIKDSLAMFFIKHSLLCQEIQVAPSR